MTLLTHESNLCWHFLFMLSQSESLIGFPDSPSITHMSSAATSARKSRKDMVDLVKDLFAGEPTWTVHSGNIVDLASRLGASVSIDHVIDACSRVGVEPGESMKQVEVETLFDALWAAAEKTWEVNDTNTTATEDPDDLQVQTIAERFVAKTFPEVSCQDSPEEVPHWVMIFSNC